LTGYGEIIVNIQVYSDSATYHCTESSKCHFWQNMAQNRKKWTGRVTPGLQKSCSFQDSSLSLRFLL